jgi:hypothetical protein
MKTYPQYNILKLKDIPIYAHLEHYVKKTNTAMRLKWLEDANAFTRSFQSKKTKQRWDKNQGGGA